METREYRTKDKTEWGPGPWQDEPDKKQWQDAATGLPCLIVRNNGGALCGYVGAPDGHAAFGKGYGDVSVECHGGLTFADFCAHSDDESRFVCHVPGEGEPDRVWWLGFDCAHSGDLSPAYALSMKGLGITFPGDYETYKTVAYVTHQVANLAGQLKAMA